MSALPKPILRGYAQRRGIKSIVGAFAFACVNGAAYYYLAALPRKKAEEESLKTYDPETHYKELLAYGYLKSPRGIE